MNSPREAILAFKNLIASSLTENEVFTRVAASRAVLALMERYPESAKTADVRKTLEGIEEATRATASLLGSHMNMRWNEHVSSLNWFSKLKANKYRTAWLDLERRTLKMRAEHRIRTIMSETYPEGMRYPEIAQIFTHGDLEKMKIR